jgi:subtilisin family serine protease
MASRGYLVCVAAGNDGEGYASCPGLSRGAITVAALDKGLKRADFSSCKHPDYLAEKKPDLGAPGVNIGSTTTGLIATMNWYEGPKVAFISGTSMATPHASSLMALWAEYAREKGVELTRDVVMDVLSHYGSWNEETGYGCPRFEWIVDYLR